MQTSVCLFIHNLIFQWSDCSMGWTLLGMHRNCRCATSGFVQVYQVYTSLESSANICKQLVPITGHKRTHPALDRIHAHAHVFVKPNIRNNKPVMLLLLTNVYVLKTN